VLAGQTPVFVHNANCAEDVYSIEDHAIPRHTRGGAEGDASLFIDEGGSFEDDSESALLRVDREGDSPVVYFDVDPDKEYGYEVRRVSQDPPQR
jgi:hypothetical protein